MGMHGDQAGPANEHGDQKLREGDVARLNNSTVDFKQSGPSSIKSFDLQACTEYHRATLYNTGTTLAIL